MRLEKRHIVLLTATVLCLVLGYSCANMATPTGGAYDFDPPRLLRTSPALNSVNVTGNKITLEFDENVKLVNQSEKIIITPPQQKMPQIRSSNSKLTITLLDTLMPNTTYTIDFTDAITDNNEGNVLENFAYSFSTGDHIDSLSMSGIVLAANNLEPVKSMYVGIHSNLDDSAFTNVKFLRISRTNEQGKFTLKGVAPGSYKIYALDDANRDYMYDNPSEGIAFLDSIIVPGMEMAMRQDTVSIVEETHTIDSIKTVRYTRFTPDNLVLRSFKSDFQRKYLAKSERMGNKVTFYFGAPTDMPTITPLNFDAKEIGLLEKSLRGDTISYWISGEQIRAIDTLSVQIAYLQTDTLNQDYIQTDTLNLFDRSRKPDKKEEKKKKKDKAPEIEFLNIANNMASSWDIYKKIELVFDEPIQGDLKEKIQLSSVVDSTLTAMDIILSVDSLNPRKYTIDNKWQYGKEYKLKIDSAAIHGIYGKWNNVVDQSLKVKKEDEYGNLALAISGIDGQQAFVELLDKSDNAVRKIEVVKNIALFKNINPGTYYARIILDKNGNGIWDTGDYHTKQQPDLVCYYNSYFEIKANFNIRQSWAVDTLHLEGQKPLDITKNKPKDKDTRLEQLKEEDAKQQGKQQRQRDIQEGKYDPNDPNNPNNRKRNNK